MEDGQRDDQRRPAAQAGGHPQSSPAVDSRAGDEDSRTSAGSGNVEAVRRHRAALGWGGTNKRRRAGTSVLIGSPGGLKKGETDVRKIIRHDSAQDAQGAGAADAATAAQFTRGIADGA